MENIIILGAGAAGLSAGYFLSEFGYNVILLEKNERIGGLSATIKVKDYLLDYGPHSYHLKDSNITDLFNDLVGEESNYVTRKARMLIDGKNLQFPLGVKEALFRLNPILSTKIILSFLYSKVFRNGLDENNSFKDAGIKNFGKVLYKIAFGDYSEKMWGLAGSELSAKLAKQKLQTLNFKKLILSTLGLLNKKETDYLGLNTNIVYDAYPKKGMGVFWDKLADRIRKNNGKVILSTKINKLNIKNNKVYSIEILNGKNKENIECDKIVSTIPLNNLSNYIQYERFSQLNENCDKLEYRDMIFVYLVLDKDYFSNAHWIYLLDSKFISNRLSEQKNLSKESCPEGLTVLAVDISCNKGDYLWNANDSFIISLAMQDLNNLGIHPRRIIDAFVLKRDNVYPIYCKGFENNIKSGIDMLSKIENLYSIGRQGLFLNNDMHDSMEMGYMVAMSIKNEIKSSQWYEIAQQYVEERLEGIKKDPHKIS